MAVSFLSSDTREKDSCFSYTVDRDSQTDRQTDTAGGSGSAEKGTRRESETARERARGRLPADTPQ